MRCKKAGNYRPLGPTFPLFVIFKNKNIDGKIDLFVTQEAIVGTCNFIFHMISHFPFRALTANKDGTSRWRPVKITRKNDGNVKNDNCGVKVDGGGRGGWRRIEEGGERWRMVKEGGGRWRRMKEGRGG